jgi:hypothetical protein
MRIRLSSYLNRWVVLGSIFFSLALCSLCFLVLIIFMPVGNSQSGFSTAVFTLMPYPTDTPLPTIAPTLEPEVIKTRANLITIGAQVRITGTGGEGLNVRSAPGVSNSSRFLGADNELLQVKDGPVTVDGYTWWYLITPGDESRSGWAVEAFLKVENGQ